METVKNYIKTTWEWFYERTVLWIILFLGISFMMSLNNLSIQSSKIEKGNADCKISCHPVSYEYIQNNQSNNCWCYKDTSTLIPAKR